uniref:Uncharacterized protein n=1 Tax=Paramormyrops kingsleyae TaxID=1676925 RepID=A0A3B3QUB7_9TELE
IFVQWQIKVSFITDDLLAFLLVGGPSLMTLRYEYTNPTNQPVSLGNAQTHNTPYLSRRTLFPGCRGRLHMLRGMDVPFDLRVSGFPVRSFAWGAGGSICLSRCGAIEEQNSPV